MKLLLSKGDPWLVATLFVLSLEPIPYTIEDRCDCVCLSFPESIDPMRMFLLGSRTAEMMKAVLGVGLDYRQKYPPAAVPEMKPYWENYIGLAPNKKR